MSWAVGRVEYASVKHPKKPVTHVRFDNGAGNVWEVAEVPDYIQRPLQLVFGAFESWIEPVNVTPILMSGAYVVKELANCIMEAGGAVAIWIEAAGGDHRYV